MYFRRYHGGILRIVEEPLSTSAEVTIYVDRLKFFTTKVKIWEYAKIPASDFQKLSFDDRASISKIIIQTCRQNILWVQVYCLFICFFILALVPLISCSKIVTRLIKNLIFLSEILFR